MAVVLRNGLAAMFLLFLVLVGAAEAQESPKIPAPISKETHDNAVASATQAIARGMKWIADSRQPDGGWSDDFIVEPDSPPPDFKSGTKPTSLALLTLLGAGQSSAKGPYKQAISEGIVWLVKNQKQSGELSERADTDSHAMATLVLCEAIRINKDEALREPAQKALQFIESEQDAQTGGWSDTIWGSGWPILALTSGKAAGLMVSPDCLKKAGAFLDRFQSGEGAHYGTEAPFQEAEDTAIGLACRRALGWKADHPALSKGLDYLREQPEIWLQTQTRLFMTIACRGTGERWTQWHVSLQLKLALSQSRTGDQAGSWPGPKGTRGDVLLYRSSLELLSPRATSRNRDL